MALTCAVARLTSIITAGGIFIQPIRKGLLKEASGFKRGGAKNVVVELRGCI